MLEFFYDFALFFLKTFTVSACIIIVCGSILALSVRSKRTHKEEMSVEKLNDRYLELKDGIMEEVLDSHEWKKYVKTQKEEQKEVKEFIKQVASIKAHNWMHNSIEDKLKALRDLGKKSNLSDDIIDIAVEAVKTVGEQ